MMWMYDIPTGLLGILIIGVTMAMSVGGYVLLHRVFPGERSDETRNLAVSFIGIVCAFHSLLLAFSAVHVWQEFQSSAQAVAKETNAVEDVYRDLTLYGGPQATAAAKTLLEYVRVVVNEEWTRMAAGKESDKADALADQVFQQAGSLDPTTPREQVVFAEIFRHLNELIDHRHERLHDAQSAMPDMFWTTILITTGLVIGYTGMLPLSRVNLTMIAGMSAAMGIIFFFIVALDHPFSGGSAVSPGPLLEFLAHFDKPAK